MTETGSRSRLHGSFGRRIRYLRLSVTSACQLDCFYCSPRGRDDTERNATSLTTEGLVRLVKALPGVGTVLAVTDGLALERSADALQRAGLDGVNVSLDTLNPRRLAAITGAFALNKLLRGIDEAIRVGLVVKLNTVMLREVNHEELPAIARYERSRRLFVRFIERMGPHTEAPRAFTRDEAFELLRFSHFEKNAKARMVDVSSKPVTRREARASALVTMSAETVSALRHGPLAKGSPFEVARIAGIQAAKRTFELIPMCHPLAAEHVDMKVQLEDNGVRIQTAVIITGRTGAEMEALTATSAAALTIYDMCKSKDRAMVICDVRLDFKTGGKSGTYDRKFSRNSQEGRNP